MSKDKRMEVQQLEWDGRAWVWGVNEIIYVVSARAFKRANPSINNDPRRRVRIVG